jgi:lipopolysaccharide export LptBFGC system permease protein LptF
MKCLDRYIFFKFANKFALFFVVLNAFLFCSDTYTYLENFLRHHIPLGDVFYHYVAQGTIYLPLILPLTFVVALVFVFIAMQRNNEITVLLSSGIGFFKITRMLWFLGLVGSVILSHGNFYWIPKAYEYSIHYLENLEKNDADTPFANHLTLNTKNRLWYINRYDKMENHAFEIAVHEYDSKGKEWRRIAAQSGYFDEKTHAWTLEQGREILFPPKKQIPDEVRVFERCVFPELNDSPQLMLLLQSPLQDLSLPQLQQLIEEQKIVDQHKSYQMRFWDLILKSTFCFFSCWIALPLLFSTLGKNYWHGVMRLGALLLAYGILSHTLYALGASGAIHWLCAPSIPFCFLILMPLAWIRKL